MKFTSAMYGKALAKRVKAKILYATETGKSETYAKVLCDIFLHAFNATVIMSPWPFTLSFPVFWSE